MNQKKELIKNTLIISIGKFSTQVLSFLLLPLYTSLLTTSEYGSYDLLNTISMFLIPCVTLLMEEGMFRFLIDAKTDKEKSEVFTITIVFSLFSFLIWSIILFITGTIINYPFTVYLIFYILASILSALAGSTARGLSKFKLYSLFCFLSSLLTISLNVLFITVLHWGVSSLFLSYIIGNSIVSIWLLFKVKIYKHLNVKTIKPKRVKEMLKYSLPLVPNSLSWTIIALTDRLLIINYLTEGQNGVYSVANRFPTIINTCYGYFNLSWKESASKALNNKDKDEFYNSVYKSLQHFLICVSILIIAALPFVFNLLIKNEFREAYYYIPILVISVYFSNMSNFCSGIFSAYKDTKILAQTTVVSTILNLVLGFLFIRYIGLYATALATGISYVIIYIYRNIKLRKYLVLKKDNFLLTSFLILIFVCLLYYIKNYILCGIGLLVAILYSYYINKSFIDVFINKFRRKA